HSTAPTRPSTLSLHDALPISHSVTSSGRVRGSLRRGQVAQIGDDGCPFGVVAQGDRHGGAGHAPARVREIAVERGFVPDEVCRLDRKSTRLNSSHVKISYAVF